MCPAISVVVPMLNAENDLEALFASLLNQDFDQPWEIIAVDNDSDDDTVSRARTLLQSSRPVNLVRSEVLVGQLPRGYATPRNAGALATTAPLLAFCDADGAVDSGWLKAIAHALEIHPLVESRKFHTNDVSNRDEKTAWFEQRESFKILGVTFATTAGLGCTRELFDALGGFDSHFDTGGEDTDFSLRARFELGVEPFMEQKAVYWTKVPQNRTNAFSKGYRNARAAVRLYERHLDQNLLAPFGPSAILLCLRNLGYRLLRLRRSSTASQIQFATDLGNFIGRLEWSVRFGVWFMRERAERYGRNR
jgi:glycosyltransferase involved in cell wall biosynthesis